MLDMNNPNIALYRKEFDELRKWEMKEYRKIEEKYKKDYPPEIRARSKDLLASLQHPIHKEASRRLKELWKKYDYLFIEEEKTD